MFTRIKHPYCKVRPDIHEMVLNQLNTCNVNTAKISYKLGSVRYDVKIYLVCFYYKLIGSSNPCPSLIDR